MKKLKLPKKITDKNRNAVRTVIKSSYPDSEAYCREFNIPRREICKESDLIYQYRTNQ